ncbi:MAG TPA: GNAT family N-acetyltransferase [Pyrinomonadaceae bacterium]|nr:GNAT family N-acetyltransferase [Pyrinomonadaceae bacterium]
MKIRRASTEDHPQLTQLAREAKRHWGYPDHWLKHWETDLTITPEYISENHVFAAEEEGRLVGFYALLMSGDKGELDHMWVSPDRMGTGVGKALFVHAMRAAKGQNLSEVEILSDPNAEGFYQKMGAYRTGESVSEVAGESRVLPRLTVDPASS